MNITLHVDHIGGLGEIQAKRLANAILVLNGAADIARPDVLAIRVDVDTSAAVEAVKDLQAAAAAAGIPVVTGEATLPGSTVVTAGESMPDPAQVFGGASAAPLASAPAPAAAEASPTAPAAPTATSTASNAAPSASTTATAGAPAAAPAPANGVAVDKTGLPWDTRIHSSSRAQNKDGTWRLRKGVAEMTVKAVERELREGMANAVTPTPETAPAAPPAPAAAPAAPAAPPAPAAAPAAPPAPAAGGAPLDFPGIVTRVVKLQGEGKLTQADLTAHANALGLNAFADLARSPDLFQTFVDRLPA